MRRGGVAFEDLDDGRCCLWRDGMPVLVDGKHFASRQDAEAYARYGYIPERGEDDPFA